MPINLRRPVLGYVTGFTSAAIFGFNGSVMSVLLMHDTLSAAQVTLLRSFVAMVLTGLVLLFVDRSAFKISKRQLGLVAILGIAGVAMLNQFYALAVATIDVGIALLFEYLAVPAVAVIALIFFKEKVRARIWVSIGFVIVGLAFVAQVWNSSLNPLGVFYASMAACAYVIYFLLGERALRSMTVMGMIFWALLFSTAFWAVFSEWWIIDVGALAEVISLEGNLSGVSVPFWVPLSFTLIVGSFITYILSFVALKHLKPTSAGIVASSEVLFAFLVAWFWLNETLNAVQLLGAAVVAAGIVLAQTARPGKVFDLDLATSEHRPSKSQ
jgi:drug/metabolite transporter (DMT)-like permease